MVDIKYSKLGEVCRITYGKGLTTKQLKIEGFPVFGANGVIGFNDKYICEESEVLISCRGAYSGKINFSPPKCFVTNNSLILEIKDKALLDKKFLFHILHSVNKSKLVTGTAQPQVTINNAVELHFPVPPISVQRAIVSKIEELSSEIDKGIEELKTAQQQLKVYRQAVLKWAFEGKLLESKSEWGTIRLGDVAFAIDPQPSHRTPPKVEKGIPFVSTKDFDHEADKIDFTNARTVALTILKEHLERYQLEAGDFVIGKIGTIGKPVRVVLPQDYALSANIVLIQPRKINSTYLYYFFQSNHIEKAFRDGQRATTQAAFGIQKVRELEIHLPSDDEQQQIVQEIESRLSVCDKIEETITYSLKQAEALRQSILKKALEGKLI